MNESGKRQGKRRPLSPPPRGPPPSLFHPRLESIDREKVKKVTPAARRNAKLSFDFIYSDKHGHFKVLEKWSCTKVNERLSEIQGLLELSIQKSSYEQDTNKDRLFMYLKENGKLPLSASAIGVCSFDFLGLGYHVDWPLSIVLTPAALKIYADMFNF